MRDRVALLAIAGANILADFLYPLAVIQVLGAGAESDGFFFFATLNLFFLLIFVQPIAGVVTTRLAVSRSDAEWRRFAWAGHLGAALIYGAIAVGLLLSAALWLGVLMPRTGSLALYQAMLPWQAATLVCAGMHTSAAAALQSRRRFILVEVVALLCAAAFYWPFREALSESGVVAASAVLTGRAVTQLFLTLLLSGWPVWQGVPEIVKEFFWQFRFPVVAAVYCKTDIVVDRYLLGQSRDGLLSVYHFAQQCLSILSALFSKTLVPPLRVAAAEEVAGGDMARLRRRVRRHVRLAFAITAACLTVALLAGRRPAPLAGLLQISPALLSDAAGLILALGGQTLGGFIGLTTNAVFYAAGRQGTVALAATCLYTLFLPLKVAAFSLGGIWWLALATSLHYLVAAVLLLFLLSRVLRRPP